MPARDLAVYVGRNSEGHWVWVQIAIHPGEDRTVTYTDHTEGPAPERISISGTVLSSPRHPCEAADRYWVSAGQIRDELDDIQNLGDLSRLEVAALARIWDSSHLNDMQAACDHMTPEMLAQREGEPIHGEGGWQYRMLDTVVCPVNGYRYGRAWLAKRADPADLEILRTIQRKAR